MSTSKGRFISFEGIDGCGKSTQVSVLLKKLKLSSKNLVLVREPGGTSISEKIRDILLDKRLNETADRTEALLMTASRAQLTSQIILPSLGKGDIVIADRYYDSTLAYQGGGRKLDIEWLIKLNKFATYNLEPDVTFLIDISPEEALKRKAIEEDRIEEAGVNFQIRVRKTYLNLSKRFHKRYITIDGHDSPENIHSIIISELKRRKYI